MSIMPMTPRAVLEDRWSRLQTMIRKEAVQALILCGRGKIGSYGNIHYVSSYYLYSVSSYAVLMPDGVPMLVLSLWRPEARELGLGDLVPDFHAADFTSTMFRVAGQSAMGEQLVHVLRSKKLTAGPVGIVGLSGIMPVEDYLYVRKTLPDLELRDVTPAYSAVKAIKSRAEVALIEETYEIADAGFMCFVEQLAVGKTEWEVCGEVEGTVRKLGALQTYIFSESDEQYPRCATARRYESHDLIACFVEVIGPNGTWVEKVVPSPSPRRRPRPWPSRTVRCVRSRTSRRCCGPASRWNRHSAPPSARPTEHGDDQGVRCWIWRWRRRRCADSGRRRSEPIRPGAWSSPSIRTSSTRRREPAPCSASSTRSPLGARGVSPGTRSGS